jgi:5-methylcytosine-specific restriction endonuclease McrA
MGQLTKPALILNKNWIPIRVETVRKSLKYVFDDKAKIVDPKTYEIYTFEEWITLPVSYNEDYIVTSGGDIRVPTVILLKGYGKVPNHKVRLTRRNLLIRDHYRDQYTGELLSNKDATLDHVIPKSKGGKTTWTNLVIASKAINKKKADKTPHEAGLTLKRSPYEPTWNTFFTLYITEMPDDWKNFLKALKVDEPVKSYPLGQAV